MAFEKFIEKRFQQKTLDVIKHAQEITEDYKRRGFVLTLRQLYYQFVSRDLLPNQHSEYKRLGSIIDDARQAGMLDWSTIEDRTRNVEKPNVWSSPESILKAVAEQYQENPWLNQECRPEVWIEKDALVGVIEGVCAEYRVPYFACRGYASQSEIYEAGKRFQQVRRAGFKPVVFYLGDHDPSGIHMPVDVASRLELFSRGDVEVVRIALNRDQIDEYDPPPNPAKETDSRFEGYAAEHGDESWELDALDPDVINDLIKAALESRIDHAEWDRDIAAEEDNQQGLQGVHDNFDSVKKYLKHRLNHLDLNDYVELSDEGTIADLEDLVNEIDNRD